MKKTVFGCAIVIGLILIVFAILKISRGGDKTAVPFLGTWRGQLTVEKVNQGPDGVEDRKHHTLRGWVSVRLDRKKYLMHLDGEQQQVDITGTWTINGNQITLDPIDPKVKTEGGRDGIDPNFKYLPDEDLQESYSKKITLKLSKDGSTLEGLRTTIAFLEGTHSFKKE